MEKPPPGSSLPINIERHLPTKGEQSRHQNSEPWSMRGSSRAGIDAVGVVGFQNRALEQAAFAR